MRRRRALYTAALCAVILSPLKLGATTISIGGTAWFTWWDASWTKESFSPDFRVKPNFLYGPAISLSLPKGVTISSLLQQGKFKAKQTTLVPTGAGLFEVTDNRNTWRLDSDSHISFAVTDFFRILVGFKYTYYYYSIKSFWGVLYLWGKIWYNEYAPALGLSFNIHLVQNLYLVIQSSVIYNFSVRKQDQYMVFIDTSGPQLLPSPSTVNENRIGSNSSLMFAYHIEPANITFSLGGRYQLYKALKKSAYSDPKYMDHFYGVTASVMYTFHATHNTPVSETDKVK